MTNYAITGYQSIDQLLQVKQKAGSGCQLGLHQGILQLHSRDILVPATTTARYTCRHRVCLVNPVIPDLVRNHRLPVNMLAVAGEAESWQQLPVGRAPRHTAPSQPPHDALVPMTGTAVCIYSTGPSHQFCCPERDW